MEMEIEIEIESERGGGGETKGFKWLEINLTLPFD
jgi:hypothetical protein